MKRSDVFPSKYVSKDDVDPPVVWTIAGVQKIEMDDDNGDKKAPPVMSFNEDGTKPLILNNTNWMVLEDLYGEDSDLWTDKPIELYKDSSVMFGGKRVGGVRVRKPTAADPIEGLKDLRARLKAAGATPPPIKPSHIDTPEKIAKQIEFTKSALAEALAASI